MMVSEESVDNRCRYCGTVMGKNGWKWSGRKKVQKWLCSSCGRVTTRQRSNKCQRMDKTVDTSVPTSYSVSIKPSNMTQEGDSDNER